MSGALVLCNSVDYRSHLIVKHYFHIFSSKSLAEILELAMHRILFLWLWKWRIAIDLAWTRGQDTRKNHIPMGFTRLSQDIGATAKIHNWLVVHHRSSRATGIKTIPLELLKGTYRPDCTLYVSLQLRTPGKECLALFLFQTDTTWIKLLSKISVCSNSIT